MKKNDNKPSIWSQNRVLYGVLVVFAFILYGNTIPNQYALDDIYVTNGNPQTSRGFSALPEIFTSRYANVNNDDGSALRFGYRPIVKATFAIEHQFFKRAPHVSHFINVLLYALVLVVLFQLLRKLMRDYHLMFPFLVVMIFAAHPAHTEVVASLKNRDELLVTLFAFLSMHSFLKYFDERKTLYLLGGMGLFLLAYLSKASAMVYLAVFPVALYFFREVNARKLLWVAGSALLVVIVARYVPRFFLPPPERPVLFVENPLLFEDSKLWHVSTGFNVLLFYLKKMFWPLPLLFYYGYNMIPVVGFGNAEVIASILIHLALAGYAIYLLPKKHILSFAILLYFITISIYANMVKPVMGIVADRFLFAAVLALAIALVYFFFRIAKAPLKNPAAKLTGQKTLLVLMLLVLIPFSAITIDRNADWETQLKLTESDIGHLENSAKGNYLYALSLKNEVVGKQSWKKPEGQKKVDLMLKHYKRAIEIYPEYYDAWNQLGEIFMVVKRDYDVAERFFKKALEINPDMRKAYYNIGYMNYIGKNYEKARSYFKKFLEYEPEHEQVHSFMSKMAFREKNLEKALEWNEKILDFNPESALAYFNMGNYLLQSGDTIQAVENFEKAVDLNPNNTQLNKNLYRYFTGKGNERKANYYLNLNNK